MSNNEILFREVQVFRQKWLMAVLALPLVVPAIFCYGIYRQIILGQPWGDRPMSDSTLIVTAIGAFLLTAGSFLLFLATRLTTEVRKDGVYCRFFPFHMRFRRIPLEKVTTVEARTYSPIADYGGWGIRYGLNGRAYNVSGNRGVLFIFTDGKTLLLGSQRPEELARAVERVNLTSASTPS